MIVVAIRTKSGDGTAIRQTANSIPEVEKQIMAILKKQTPYVTFVDVDNAAYTVKRTEIEGFTVAEIKENADDKETS